jgi:hypothetical protein
MPVDFDITPVVREYSSLPFERLTVVRRFEDLPLSQIRRGIIYFFAGWSGPSVSFFRQATDALASMNSSSLEIYVVDIDCVPEEFMTDVFGKTYVYPSGSGETAWIRDGRVVSVMRTYPRADFQTEVLRRTTELLQDNAPL